MLLFIGDRKERGFTVVELLVVSTIIIVLGSLALAGHGRFSDGVVLSNLAHDVSLSIRQAQSYGLNVQRDEAGASYDVSYGIRFDSATPQEYVLFIDRTRLGDGVDFDAVFETFELAPGYRILDVCATTNTAATRCFSSGGASQIGRMDIVFDRPNPDANFSTDLVADSYVNATITLSGPRGATRDIEVLPTGFINVQ